MSSLYHYQQAVLTEWRPNETFSESIIYPWGVETADSDGFFSLEQGVGYRYRLKKSSITKTESGIESKYIVKMRDGQWQLQTVDHIAENEIRRKIELLAIKNSWHMDFVMRFRFKKEHFSCAMINGLTFLHKDSNIYHQFPVKDVTLVSDIHNGKIEITLTDFETNSIFAPEMYVRDRGDEWIVHVRMMPRGKGRKIIKLCNRYMRTKALPQCLSRLILSFEKVRDALWYRGERKPYINKFMRVLNPNAFLLGKLKAGEKLSLNVECRWIS